MATLPTDYTDAATPTGATTELPATTSRGVNAINTQINANTSAISTLQSAQPAGAVVGTTDTQSLTHKTLTDVTNVFPTFNQNTTGSAATLTTARNIDGQAFNGSADITVIAPGTHAATSKTTPVDADELPLVDSAASFGLKKLTWANLKATVKSYYDSVSSTLTNKDLTSGTNTFPTFNQNTTGTAAGITGKTTPTGALVGTTDTQTLTNKTESGVTITGYTETVQALGTIGSTKTIPAVSAGTLLWGTLTSATACTFTMPTAAAGLSFILVLRQPASGTATTATFTGVKWPASGAPTLTATVGKADAFTFFCYDGTNWYGAVNQGYTY